MRQEAELCESVNLIPYCWKSGCPHAPWKGGTNTSLENHAAVGGGGHGGRRSLQSLPRVKAVSSTIHSGSRPGLWDWQDVRGRVQRQSAHLSPGKTKNWKEEGVLQFRFPSPCWGAVSIPDVTEYWKGSLMPSFQVSIQLAGLLMHPLTSCVFSVPVLEREQSAVSSSSETLGGSLPDNF